MKSNQIFLGHIRDSINDIIEAIAEQTFEKFATNKILLKAVVRDFEIIGEASNNLTGDFRDANPQIIWRDLIDMRNEMIHEYFGIVPEEVWQTCQKDLPVLKEQIERLLV